MKKIQYILLTAISLSTVSCSDFLDQKPDNYISDAAVIQTLSSAKAALNGAYHDLASSSYYGGQYFDAGVNLAADNVTWTGSLNYYYDFDTHQYSAENQLLSYAWYAIYATVNQTNQVIDKVTVLNDGSESERRRIIAEATVIRSLAFFDLARTWGNIPVVKQATSSPTQFDGVKQTKAKDVYRLVVDDVLAIYNDLSELSDRVHVTRSAADAFLARVYLYLEQWDKAEQYASKVIDNGNYTLGTIQDLIDNKETAESIWELAYSSSFTNQQSTYWRSPDQGGRHEWGPSKELVQLLADPTVGGDRKAFYQDFSSAQVPDYFVGTLYHRSTLDDDVIIFRLAEQYLIRAEARANQQNVSGALSDLNIIRRRANVSEIVDVASTQELLNLIADERRVELALEPHRWFDLIRTGKAESVLGIKTYQTLFPIPYNDIQADKDLVQNDNY